MSVEFGPKVSRRRFGATLLSLLALGAIRTDRRAKSHDFDFASLTDPASAAAIGAAYLRKHPDQASRDVLLRFLALPDQPLTAAQITGEIESRIRSDFACQRTVVLERWLLSRTELAVCALIALA